MACHPEKTPALLMTPIDVVFAPPNAAVNVMDKFTVRLFPELLVILGVAVLLFGGKKIPEVAKGLGEGIRNFKTSLKGEEEKVEEKKQQA